MGAESVELQQPILSPGQRLKSARESRHIEINDIARWLKLDAKLIKALEDDDDDRLPEPVFTAGYIRSYAKLVELAPDSLVKDFMKTHTPPEPEVVITEETVPDRLVKVAEALPKRFSDAINSNNLNVKWAAAITAVIAVVGITSWFSLSHLNSDEQLVSSDGGSSVIASSENISTTIESNIVVQSGDAVEASTPAKDIVAEQKPAQASRPSSASTDIETKTAAVESEAPKRITVPLQLKKRERSESGAIVGIAEESLMEMQKLRANISLHFTADSWVDIRDATGKPLIRSLGVAGVTKEVEGVAPFQVLLGYGPGVQITYNGEPYDFQKFQGRQEVARFTIDASKDHQD